MGGTAWSDAHYHSRATHRAATNAPVFEHTANVRSGRVRAGVHEALDPKRVVGAGLYKGQNIREARDSEAHPLSSPVAVFCDVTGSMLQVPQTLQAKLVTLMGLLLRKSYLPDPAIMIGAVGDAFVDQAPLQLGQFESGIEIENDLTNLYLEGGGGGSAQESYELALYALARKTRTDAWEKRGKRGYAFLIGDEKAYDQVNRGQVERIFGDTLQADIPVRDILAEAQERWDIYYIMPNLTTYYGSDRTFPFWRDLLGQQALKLEDPNGISEFIATLIGVGEGTAVDVERDLTEVGTDIAVARNVAKAVGGLSKTSVAGTGLATL